MSMKSLGTLILENEFLGIRISDKLKGVEKQLKSGDLNEENINLFLTTATSIFIYGLVYGALIREKDIKRDQRC